MIRKQQAQSSARAAATTDSIDALALAGALVWLVLTALFSWNLKELSPLDAIERALLGSIIVYVVLSLAFHLIVRAAVSNRRRLRKQSAERIAASRVHQTETAAET